jgi:hypothetical protein
MPTIDLLAFENNNGDASNQVRIAFDNSSPTHSGNLFYYDGSWNALSGYDTIFYVYEGEPLVDAVSGIDFSKQISQGSDDAEEGVSSEMCIHNISDLEICYDSGAPDDEAQLVGLRFQNVTIPQGSKINNAYVRFIVDAVQSGAVNVTYYVVCTPSL